VEQFLGYAIPGIPYGCAYAIFAVGLVLTYQATGVFNFAYGAQAFTSAFLFAWMIQQAHVPIWLSFVVAVVVVGPGLGLAFDRFLFSKIPSSNTTAKVVTGLSLLVGIPTLLPVLFGSENLTAVPSIGFSSTFFFNLFGMKNVVITGFDCSTVIFTVVALVALVVLMRFTALGLRMRGAVESRRLVQLDGVNANAVVATAWAVSGLMAGLVGVLFASAPLNTVLSSESYITLMVAAIAAAAWGVLRSMPIAAGVAVLLGVVSLTAQGYLTPNSIWHSAVLPSLPFVVLVAALLLVPGLRSLDESKDPLSSVDPPVPPVAASVRAPEFDRIIKPLWWLLLAGFVVSMLTWMPATWENVFNAGLAFSTIFLSITLITGMGGQLSLAQATLAGVGAFTAGQLAMHLGLNYLVGGLIGAVLAAAVAIVLALGSLRLKGLGLALMTLAAALLFDSAVFSQKAISTGTGGIRLQRSWFGAFNFFDPNGRPLFVLAMLVLVACTIAVLLVRRGSTGMFLSAMRGSETGAAGIGINLSWQRVLVFALSGAMAGVGGTLLTLQQTSINPAQFNYEYSLVFVVIVVTTGVSTVEGAIQGGIGFVVTEQLLSYAPQRFQGLTVVLFAFGALTYAAHPQGVLEFQKTRWTQRFERLLLHRHEPTSAGSGGGGAPVAARATVAALGGPAEPGAGGHRGG